MKCIKESNEADQIIHAPQFPEDKLHAADPYTNECTYGHGAVSEGGSLLSVDHRWFGIEWAEGPDVGGPNAPYTQSQRLSHYKEAFEKLKQGGFLFPCTCSRRVGFYKKHPVTSQRLFVA